MHGDVDLTAREPHAAADGIARWPGSAVAAAFADTVESGRLNLPLAGSGRTRERWAVLADLAGEDLSLARLAEGHADALAIWLSSATGRLRPEAAGGSGPRSRLAPG